MKRNPKDRGYGYKKSYEYEDSIVIDTNLHTKYAEYILSQSSTPLDDIEWLIQNLKQCQKEELEETLRTFIP